MDCLRKYLKIDDIDIGLIRYHISKYTKIAVMIIGLIIGALVCISGTQHTVKLLFHMDLNIRMPWLEEFISTWGGIAVVAYWWNLIGRTRKLDNLIHDLDQDFQITDQLSRAIKKEELFSYSGSRLRAMDEQVRKAMKRQRRSIF